MTTLIQMMMEVASTENAFQSERDEANNIIAEIKANGEYPNLRFRAYELHARVIR